MASDAKPPSRIEQLARRDNDLRELENKVGATPAAGAGPELAGRRDALLGRINEAQQRVGKELEARRELDRMNRAGQRLVDEGKNEYTRPERKAELKEKLKEARAARDAKKKELEDEYGKDDAPKGSPDAEDPCVPCLEKDAKALDEDAKKATEEKLELARGLCDAKGSADAADKELVAQELAKMPKEDLERMKANGTRVAVCRGAVTDYKPGLAESKPRGWPEGTNWSSVPGCYDDQGNEVIVATRGHGTDAGPHVPESGDGHGSANLAIHEAYHGLDYRSGKPSSGTEFTDVRDSAPGELSDYMSQSGQAGEEESFAESAARRYGPPPGAGLNQPKMNDYWKKNPLGRSGAGGGP